MSNTDAAEHKPDFFISIGTELRKAREAQGLSLEEAANKLFLSRQRVIDIENDDFSRISSLIYARGYLRAYAKLVGVSEADILKKFSKLELQDQRDRADLSVVAKSRGAPISKQRRYMRWINLAVIAILILLVVLWWHGKRHGANEVANNNDMVQQVVIPSQSDK